MSPEQFLKLTKGKKIWWGSKREFDKLMSELINTQQYFIVDRIDDEQIIPTDNSPAYGLRNRWTIANGLYNADTIEDYTATWFILEGEWVDKVYIEKYNSALKNIDHLLKNGKIEINTDGTLKLKTGSEDK